MRPLHAQALAALRELRSLDDPLGAARAERRGRRARQRGARRRALSSRAQRPQPRAARRWCPPALLVTAGFAAIFIQSDNRLSAVSLTYGGVFLALCLAGHFVIRRALPNADPYLFPLAAALASVGIVMIYRISPTLARQQAMWLVVGLALFAIDDRRLPRRALPALENYRYLIAIVGIGSMLLPRLPGIGGQVNGAYLAVHVGSISFQPSELGKIAIVIFLASYLRDNRQVLVTAGRRILGVTIPPMKQFGPLLLVWGAAMAMLLVTREIGTSLMFFGAFLAVLYVATGRASFPLVGARPLRRRRVLHRDPRRPHPRPRARLGAPLQPRRSTTQPTATTSSPTASSRRPTAACSASASTSRSSRSARRAPARRRERLDLRRDHERDRPRRRAPGCCSPTSSSSVAV